MRRRTFVSTLGLSALAATLPGGLAGCAAAPSAAGVRFRTPSGVPLRRVDVAEDRIIRTVVGLRPFRPSGFRVAAEKRDAMLLVHNYGHGGGGWTLSWGTAHLALEHALASEHRRAAVIGCGIVGLTTARLLQRHGFEVEIHTAELPPKTTSNIAGAQWSPASVYDRDAMTPTFAAQLERALTLSYRYFQEQVGTRYGVRWVSNYLLSDDPFDPDNDFRADYPSLYPEAVDLAPAEHPFPAPHARHFDTMFMEPPHYLPVIEDEFRRAGGRIHRRRFADVAELDDLGFPVVVNCTGLGAGELVGDGEIMPIKGQLTVLLPQEEVDYLVIHDGRYMFPRADGVLLGGTHERGEWSLDVNEEAKARILAGHRAFFGAMDDPLARPRVGA